MTTARSPIRTLLVDDHPLFRRGLAQLLNESQAYQVVSELDSGQTLIPALREHQPDLLLLDLNMPDFSGLDLLQQVRAADIPVRVVVITASEDDEDLFRALSAGADGFLMKDTGPSDMLAALQGAMTGQVALNPTSVNRLAQALRNDAFGGSAFGAASGTAASRTAGSASEDNSATSDLPDAQSTGTGVQGIWGHGPDTPTSSFQNPDLTARERQTLLLIAQGLNNKLIARELGISDGTVKVYVKSLLRKLDLHSRLELAAWVHKHPDAASLSL